MSKSKFAAKIRFGYSQQYTYSGCQLRVWRPLTSSPLYVLDIFLMFNSILYRRKFTRVALVFPNKTGSALPLEFETFKMMAKYFEKNEFEPTRLMSVYNVWS